MEKWKSRNGGTGAMEECAGCQNERLRWSEGVADLDIFCNGTGGSGQNPDGNVRALRQDMHDYQLLRNRTFHFAVCIVGFCRDLPRTWEARRIAEQLFDAGTSVAANYRAACRARSRKEFIAKICITIEEADECELWCALLQRCGIGIGSLLDKLAAEAAELRAIFVASRNTARSNAGKRGHVRTSG